MTKILNFQEVRNAQKEAKKETAIIMSWIKKNIDKEVLDNANINFKDWEKNTFNALYETRLSAVVKKRNTKND